MPSRSNSHAPKVPLIELLSVPSAEWEDLIKRESKTVVEARIARAEAYLRTGHKMMARKVLTKAVCGGRNRRDGSPCLAGPAGPSGRCKWHGGLSTGARTPGGLERCQRALATYWERRRAAKLMQQFNPAWVNPFT